MRISISDIWVYTRNREIAIINRLRPQTTNMFTTNIDFAAIKKQQSKLGKDFSEASNTIQQLPISENARTEIMAILKHEYDCRISETMKQQEPDQEVREITDLKINHASLQPDGSSTLAVTIHDSVPVIQNHSTDDAIPGSSQNLEL